MEYAKLQTQRGKVQREFPLHPVEDFVLRSKHECVAKNAEGVANKWTTLLLDEMPASLDTRDVECIRWISNICDKQLFNNAGRTRLPIESNPVLGSEPQARKIPVASRQTLSAARRK